MQLTEHFSLDEMLASPTAIAKGITEQFSPPQSVIDNLTALCANVLEPLRAKIGKPIIITSGYRCPRLNAAIGGAMSSQHQIGCAADTHVEGMSIEEWFQFVKAAEIPTGQIIQEFNEWVHISHDLGEQRNECLRATRDGNGNTEYNLDSENV